MTDRSPQRPHKGADHLPTAGLLSFAGSAAPSDAIRIVCAALGLACVVLALRIASIW